MTYKRSVKKIVSEVEFIIWVTFPFIYFRFVEIDVIFNINGISIDVEIISSCTVFMFVLINFCNLNLNFRPPI